MKEHNKRELYKICEYNKCRRFFLIKNMAFKQRFCSDKCRHSYHNLKHLNADKEPLKQFQLEQALIVQDERDYY